MIELGAIPVHELETKLALEDLANTDYESEKNKEIDWKKAEKYIKASSGFLGIRNGEFIVLNPALKSHVPDGTYGFLLEVRHVDGKNILMHRVSSTNEFTNHIWLGGNGALSRYCIISVGTFNFVKGVLKEISPNTSNYSDLPEGYSRKNIEHYLSLMPVKDKKHIGEREIKDAEYALTQNFGATGASCAVHIFRKVE